MMHASKKAASLNVGEHFWGIMNAILLLVIVVSAFMLVYLKDVYRRDFIDYQSRLNQAMHLQVEHNRLLLEESTWASDARIQEQANKILNMVVADTSEMIVVPENDAPMITPME